MTDILAFVASAIALLTLVGLFFGPAYSNYKNRQGGTHSDRLKARSDEWDLDGYGNAISNEADDFRARMAAKYQHFLKQYPVAYVIRSEVNKTREGINAAARIAGGLLRSLGSRLTSPSVMAKLDVAQDKLGSQMESLEATTAALQKEQDYVQQRSLALAAIIATLLFLIVIPFNFFFAVTAVSGGRFINASIDAYFQAFVIVILFEVVGGAMLFFARNTPMKILAGLIVLAGCAGESVLAMSSEMITGMLEAANLPVFEATDDAYSARELTGLGYGVIGFLGTVLGIAVALVTENFFRTVFEAREAKAQRFFSKAIKDGNKFAKAVLVHLDDMKLAASNTRREIELTQGAIGASVSSSDEQAQRAEDLSQDLLTKVDERMDAFKPENIENRRLDNELLMKAAPLVALTGLLFIGMSLVLYNHVFVGFPNRYGVYALSLMATIMPFLFGAALLKPVASSGLTYGEAETTHFNLTRFARPTMFLIVLVGFCIALSRPNTAYPQGVSGSVILTGLMFVQVWFFMVMGSHALYIVNAFHFTAMSLFDGLIFLLKLGFITLRFTVSWLKVAFVFTIDGLFFLLALPYRLWGETIAEFRGFRP